MNPRRLFGLSAVVLVLGTGITVAARAAHRAPVLRYNIAAEQAQHDADIAFYIAHAAKDPTGALDQLQLARLYLQRARERGTPADIALAENAARQSLTNRRAHNVEAWHALALALMGEHRFVEAKAAADSLLAVDVTAPGPQGLVGEILLELGRYSEADTIFMRLDHGGNDPAILARTSRWAALRGHAGHARELLMYARDVVRSHTGVPAEQIAWYDLRLGELALTTGQLDLAETHLATAASVVPDDPRIMLAQSRLATAQGNYRAALKSAERAMNAGEDPLAFALAADAHAALGDTANANRMMRVFETAIAAAPPSAWHRQWRLELLDHNRQVAEVLRQAQEDLVTRRDVYGYDLYAWALHHVGRDAEARAAMREALRWNTQDVLLTAHAKALGVSP